MSSNSFDFSNMQARVSSLYESAATYAESALEMIQKLLPSLTATDAKTMLFGAAFFAAICEDWQSTSAFTVVGAFWGQTICDFGSKHIELFNDLPSQTKYAIVAGAIAVLAILRFAGHLTNEFLKSATAAAVGFYAGLVLGDSRL